MKNRFSLIVIMNLLSLLHAYASEIEEDGEGEAKEYERSRNSDKGGSEDEDTLGYYNNSRSGTDSEDGARVLERNREASRRRQEKREQKADKYFNYATRLETKGSAKAPILFLKAARLGHDEAKKKLKCAEVQNELGHYYLERQDQNTEQNRKKALNWYKKAEKQGNIDAQFYVGCCYFHGYGVEKKEKEGLSWFKTAAKREHTEAQFYTGCCYFYGHGVRKDEKKALKWFEKGAKAGHAESQFYTGFCYFYGHGVEKNEELAVKWYQKAAEQENAEAQYALGVYYVEKDEEKKRSNVKKSKIAKIFSRRSKTS